MICIHLLLVFINVINNLAIQIYLTSDCNGARTHNHLARKGTLTHLAKLANLAKWLSVPLRTKRLRVRVP